jgi:nucleotide-binding universal stress UspA family protein
VRKMLVLLNRLDIEERLPELRDIIMTQGVGRVYLASVPSAFGWSAQSIAPHKLPPVERVVVYLVRVSRAFSARVRSRVAPHKLDLAARMGDAAANKYLSKIADALYAEGVEAVPIGVSIPTEKIGEYIKRNNIDLVVTGDGRSGLCSWPSGGLTERSLQSVYEYDLTEELVAFERRKAKARYGLRIKSGILLQFSALFLFWLILSGHYQLEHQQPW